MKQINLKMIFQFIVIVLLLISCNNGLEKKLKAQRQQNEILAKEFLNKISGSDFRIGIIYESNFGFKTNVNAQGNLLENLVCTVEDFELKANRPENSLFLKNEDYGSLFGNNINVTIKDSENSETYKFLAPKILQVNSLENNQCYEIERIGKNLTWEKDENSDGILIRYRLYDGDKFSFATVKTIEDKMELVEDNGLFNLDYLLKNKKVLSFEITFIRAKSVEFITKDNVKVNFVIESIDSHYYNVY